MPGGILDRNETSRGLTKKDGPGIHSEVAGQDITFDGRGGAQRAIFVGGDVSGHRSLDGNRGGGESPVDGRIGTEFDMPARLDVSIDLSFDKEIIRQPDRAADDLNVTG